MKTKLLVAYEPESSTTIRLIPEDIGVLLSKMSKSSLDACLSRMIQEVNMYRPTDTKAEIVNSLQQAKDSITI